MELDDELCLCFHVTKRKVVNWIRIEKPRRVGQLSECYGAGTGCGWCRSYLQRLFEQGLRDSAADSDAADSDHGPATDAAEPTAEQYAAQRSRYVRDGGGTPPPGATPIE